MDKTKDICVASFEAILQSYVDMQYSANFYKKMYAKYNDSKDFNWYLRYQNLADKAKESLIKLYTTALDS